MAERQGGKRPLRDFLGRLRCERRRGRPAGIVLAEAILPDAYIRAAFYGADAPSQNVHATLKDAQVRDKYGSPEYREYRGRQVPVFDAPKGLATIEKVRGEARWRAWFFVLPKFVSEALLLVGMDKPLYLSIHERKQERIRWVQSIALQTSDPEQE